MFVLIYGGLGNQMFQVACAINICISHKVSPKFIDINKLIGYKRKWELSFFEIHPEKLNFIQKLQFILIYYFSKITPCSFLSIFGILTDKSNSKDFIKIPPKYLIGYWQNPEFFTHSEDIVRNLFNIEQIQDNHGIPDNGLINIAVHIRRGDYVNNNKSRNKHLVCDITWYKSAIDHIKNLVNKPNNLLIFSDDMAWVQENFKGYTNLYYVEKYVDEPVKLLMLMSKCDHFVISNSTFSWWAAYLNSSNGKIICAPKFWFRDTPTSTLKICPNTWHLI